MTTEENAKRLVEVIRKSTYTAKQAADALNDMAKKLNQTTESMKKLGMVVDVAKAKRAYELLMSEKEWETPCPKREDEIHCVHWYDGEACCGCGDNPYHFCEKGCGCEDG